MNPNGAEPCPDEKAKYLTLIWYMQKGLGSLTIPDVEMADATDTISGGAFPLGDSDVLF